MTTSVSRPQAWLDTTMSDALRSMPSSAPATNVDPSREPRPGFDQSLVHASARRRQRLVDDDGRRRRIVEDEHDLREETMTTAEVDDTPAAEEPAGTPGDLPRFVELLARQHPARQTARPMRSNSVSPGNRPRSFSVKRPRDECENTRALSLTVDCLDKARSPR